MEKFFSDEEILRRAMAAWFRGGGTSYPSQSGIEELSDCFYVVLRNGSDVAAVYRVRNDGVLKRLRRWPKEIG